MATRAGPRGMVAPDNSEPPLSAPGVQDLLKTPRRTIGGPRSVRRRRNLPYAHVRLEFDLSSHESKSHGAPLLERLGQALQENQAGEGGTVVALAAATVHALAASGLRRVDHWEISPGGWLPLPGLSKSEEEPEPVGQLVSTLEGRGWNSLSSARAFSARLSDFKGRRVDARLRRGRLEPRYALTLDLWGTWTQQDVHDVEGAMAERVPVAHVAMTKFQYAEG
jgi:hypothetical protein